MNMFEIVNERNIGREMLCNSLPRKRYTSTEHLDIRLGVLHCYSM